MSYACYAWDVRLRKSYHPLFFQEYVIYTDSQTHSYAQEIFQGFPWHRYELINLDLDSRDALRMAPFRREEFDDKNWASVRRTLADCDHLDVRKGRLLLGTDVKFLKRPVDFIEAAQSLREQQATKPLPRLRLAQAVYMVDRFWQGETPDGQPVSNVTLVVRAHGTAGQRLFLVGFPSARK